MGAGGRAREGGRKKGATERERERLTSHQPWRKHRTLAVGGGEEQGLTYPREPRAWISITSRELKWVTNKYGSL